MEGEQLNVQTVLSSMARADGSPQRFYSLSALIQRERQAHYDMLERQSENSVYIG